MFSPSGCSGVASYIRRSASRVMTDTSYAQAGSYDTHASDTDASRKECPSLCCSPSPVSVVRPAVAPSRKPRPSWSPSAHIWSPVRCQPNIE